MVLISKSSHAFKNIYSPSVETQLKVTFSVVGLQWPGDAIGQVLALKDQT